MAKADLVIANDGSLAELLTDADQVLQRTIALVGGKRELLQKS